MARTSMVMSCVICLEDLKEKKRYERAKLSSLSENLKICLWTDVLNEFVEQNQRQLLHEKGVICRACKGSLSSYHKAKNALQIRLKRNRSQSSSTSSSSPHTPVAGQKRSYESPHHSTGVVTRPTVPKRLRYSTSMGTIASSREVHHSTSPSISIEVGYKVPKSFVMTPKRKYIAKSLIHGSRCSLVNHCFNNKDIREVIIKKVGRIVHQEIITMCSTKVNSMMRLPLQSFNQFSLSLLLAEFRKHAPVLQAILLSATKTKQRICTQSDMLVGVIFAILCKHRCNSMSLFQKLLSICLYANHTSKQVFTRLQRLMMCMSHEKTIQLVDEMGVDHDHEVYKWRDEILKTMTSPTLRPTPCDVQDSWQYQYSAGLDEDEEESTANLTDELIVDVNADCSDNECGSEEMEFDHVCSNGTDTETSSDHETEMNMQPNTPSTSPLVLVPPNHVEEADVPSPSQSSNPNASLPSHVVQYKLVFDNINKTVTPRFQSIDSPTTVLNYINTYAVKDRTNSSRLSRVRRYVPSNLTKEDVAKAILPSVDDDKQLKMVNFPTYVSRILVQYLPFFELWFNDVIDWHIKHPYYNEMSQKSEVFPLGVLPKDENKHEDMFDILQHLHSYVPSVHAQAEVECPITNSTVVSDIVDHHELLLGGDLLTSFRVRGVQRVMKYSDNVDLKCDGVIAISEDWHTKLTFLEVIWKHYYDIHSGHKKGHLHQLKCLVNRSSVLSSPKRSFDSCNDFLLDVTKAFVISAALSFLCMDSIDGSPGNTAIPPDLSGLNKNQRKELLNKVSQEIVQNYISFQFHVGDGDNPSRQSYFSTVLSLGMFYMEFVDSIKEGDGIRVHRCWKYLLPIFKATNRTNYSIEALRFLSDYEYTASPMHCHQMLWSRFINTVGKPGHNIPADLHMEHLNRTLKEAVKNLGSNKSEKSIIRAGKAIGTL